MKEFEEIDQILEKLRESDSGSWGKSQTLESSYPKILEKAQEVVEAVATEEPARMKEELGELMFNMMFICKIAQDKGMFQIRDVLKDIKQKVLATHPDIIGK